MFERWLNGKVEFVANCPLPDFAIDPLLETGYLFHDSDLVVMRHDRPLAGQPDITLADLSRQTRASSGTPGGRWRKVRPVFLAAWIEPPASTIDVDSVGIAKAMIVQNEIVALSSGALVTNETMSGEFHTPHRIEFPSERIGMLATLRIPALQPTAQALIHDLLAVTDALRPGTH